VPSKINIFLIIIKKTQSFSKKNTTFVDGKFIRFNHISKFIAMRVVIQRVSEASVAIGGRVHSKIGRGMMLLAGFEAADAANADKAIDRICGKIVNMRIFSDSEGKMNLSVLDIVGEILVVSQFTLHACTRKGNRPSFMRSAPPEISEPLYAAFVRRLSELLDKPVAAGVFGANMQVSLINDGPVTIVMDTMDKNECDG